MIKSQKYSPPQQKQSHPHSSGPVPVPVPAPVPVPVPHQIVQTQLQNPHGTVTPVAHTIFVQQPSASFINMNSPQMFNFQSPTPPSFRSSTGRWLISPFTPSANMNLLYTPVFPNMPSHSDAISNYDHNHNHNMNIVDDGIKKENENCDNDVNEDTDINGKKESVSINAVIQVSDKNVGTIDVEQNEIGIVTENDINYKCEICHKLLICPQHLLEYDNEKKNVNIKRDSDNQDWKCFECDDKFQDKKLLQSHLKNSHKEMIQSIQSLFCVKF